MIEEIKRIKLEELYKQKKSKSDEIEYYRQQKITPLKEELDKTRKECESLNNEYSSKSELISSPQKHFSFFEKYFTKRKEYKESKKQYELSNAYFEKQREFFEEITKLYMLIIEIEEKIRNGEETLETSSANKEYMNICRQIEMIKNAKTIFELGLTPIEAIELLESNGIQPVLSESDKVTMTHPRDYSSRESLMAVHKGNHEPTANMIKSAKDAGVKSCKTIIINGMEYELIWQYERDTVHFSLNDEVSSHMFGNWDKCKYSILIPFADIPKEKIARANPQDTFTKGSVEMSERTWILCPKNEVSKLKIFNPKAHIIGYEGESVQGYSKPFLTQLGYRPENVGMHNWDDPTSCSQFQELMQKEGIKSDPHAYTTFREDEKTLEYINMAVALSVLLRDNHLIATPEDIESVMEQLNEQRLGFGLLFKCIIISKSSIKEAYPQAILQNKKQLDIFLDKMEKNGFNISPAYISILRNLLEEEPIKKDVTLIDSSATEDEKKTIEEFISNIEKADAFNDAFNTFISKVICDSILHSQERDIKKADNSR